MIISPAHPIHPMMTSSIVDPSTLGSCVEQWDTTDTSKLTLATNDVISWDGRLGNHQLNDNGNAAQRPTLLTNQLGNKGGVQFSSATDWLKCTTLDLPAPGTTPIWYLAVLRLDQAPSSSDTILQAGAAGAYQASLYCSSVLYNIRQSNGANANDNNGLAAAGTWGRLESLFNNDTSDYIKIKGTTTTTQSAGGTDPTSGFSVGARQGSASTYCWMTLSLLSVHNAEPSDAIKAGIDAWIDSTFTTGLTT